MKKQSKRNLPIGSSASPVWKSTGQMFLDFRNLGKFTSVLLLLLTDYKTKEASYQMVSRIRSLWKASGPDFVTMYLKEAHRLTMKSLAGEPELSKIRVATRRGLPLIIPGILRLRIEEQEPESIRLVLTILSIYRVIRCRPVMKLETITKPFTGLTKVLLIPEILQALHPVDYKSVHIKMNARFLETVKSGPNIPLAAKGGILDAYAFMNFYPELLKDLELICQTTGKELYSLLMKDIDYIPNWIDKLSKAGQQGKDLLDNLPELVLGRLAKKIEPAGKVRIFAITDIWTQSALRPLNDYLFAILKKIPQDGTFDQLAPLLKLKERGCQQLYSYDLSAATDRLPIDLQAQVIGILRGVPFAEAWKRLLVSRDWQLDGVPYRYAVGQPMGALSSWASLALTHHVIIQIAARRSGWTRWFDLYAILGDDVVIADKAVAANYLSLMSSLGVDINLSKSLESQTGLAEFAKRLIGNQGDVSPLPPKLLLRTALNPLNLVATIRDMVSRGGLRRPMDLKRFIDSIPGTKKLPKDFIWNFTGPLGFLDLLGLSPFLGNRSLSKEQLELVATATDNVVNRVLIKNHYRSLEAAHSYWEKLLIAHHPWGWHAWSVAEHDSRGQRYHGRPMRVLTLSWINSFANYYTQSYKPLSGPPHTTIFNDIPSFRNLLERQEKTITKASSLKPSLYDHQLMLAPLGYTYDTVYQYMVSAFDSIDGVNVSVPSLLEKTVEKESFSNRVKLYKELETELERCGMSKVLEIRHLPLVESEGVA